VDVGVGAFVGFDVAATGDLVGLDDETLKEVGSEVSPSTGGCDGVEVNSISSSISYTGLYDISLTISMN